MHFVKVHGAGNDFVLLPDLDDQIVLDANLARVLALPHLGIGADGVIRLGPGGDGADVFMDYRNADGSVSETCGNGLRCVAKYVADRRSTNGDVIRVGTRTGVRTVQIVARDRQGRVLRARVDMGLPVVHGERRIEVGSGADRHTIDLMTVSMGNPHAVAVVDDVAGAPVTVWGPAIEHDAAFPDGTNVEFIAVPSRQRVMGRIWERGVGETLASGSGASAMAVAAHALELTGRRVEVQLPGGVLDVDWTDSTLFVTGPAVEIGSGDLEEAWLSAVLTPQQTPPEQTPAVASQSEARAMS